MDPKDFNEFKTLGADMQNYMIYEGVRQIPGLEKRVTHLEKWKVWLAGAIAGVASIGGLAEFWLHIVKGGR